MDAIAAPSSIKEKPTSGDQPFVVDVRVVAFLKQSRCTSEQVEAYQAELQHQQRSPFEIVRQVYIENLCDESVYQRYLSQALDIPLHDKVDPAAVDIKFVENIPLNFARNHTLVVLGNESGGLVVVAADPIDLNVIDHVSLVLGQPIKLCLAPAQAIRQALDLAYTNKQSDFQQVLGDVDEPKKILDDIAGLTSHDLLDSDTRAPVIKLVNMVLFEAAKRRASDVHVQPTGTDIFFRYRIDGVLYDSLQLPGHLHDEVISRIKVLGGMDIAEKRIPQDGRTSVSIGNKAVDLRISIIPTSHGERAVIRLLDKSAKIYVLDQLGLSKRDGDTFAKLLHQPHGIILVTGPTGSGKSTTLYAALQHLNSNEKNILTLEDPIEYQLPGISQTQVSNKKGMTFASGLRSVLRQDPDIIMVGEIRDPETANMAVQSSLTGHLVFSTLHTNDASGAISRLLDLGIEPFLVASSLTAVLAQRLVRLVCRKCCKTAELSNCDKKLLHLPNDGEVKVATAVGCEHCNGTGYYGRQGVFELLVVDDHIRGLIVDRAKSDTIKHTAAHAGMTSLYEDAVRKLVEGQTTIEEINRIVLSDITVTDPDDVIVTDTSE